MDLTAAQSQALDLAVNSVRTGGGPKGLFSCAGLAGTGKTFTLCKVVEALRNEGFRPAVCSPTGKAAHVINQKDSSLQATTIHRRLSKSPMDDLGKVRDRIAQLEGKGDEITAKEKEELGGLYKQADKSRNGGAKMYFTPLEPDEFLEQGYNCLVFDEASMIGRRETFEKLIARMPVPLLFFGDQGQLPPVKDDYAINLRQADVTLTEIKRQQGDSGIIPFSYHITRHDGYLKDNSLKGVTLVPRGSVAAVEPFCKDHQIVVWTNKSRWQIAPMVRKARGFEFSQQQYPFLPMIGEKLMVDANDYQLGLLRGQTLTVTDVHYIGAKGTTKEANPYVCIVKVMTEQNVEREITIRIDDLVGNLAIRADVSDKQREYWKYHARGLAVQWDGVTTAHKAQGSQWKKVCYLGEMRTSHEIWRRHAYTAVTRAAEELVVCAPELA